jgi:transposase, IS30 family
MARVGRPPLPMKVRRVFWDAIGRGATVAQAATSAGVCTWTGRRWVKQAGGVRPRGSAVRAGALTFAERVRIAELVQEGMIPSRIARALGRPVSTITRELARGRDSAGYYLAGPAQARAEANAARPQPRKLATHPALLAEVQARLDRKDSPEQIAGRLRHDYPDDPEMWVSHESIYKALYVQGKGALLTEVKEALRTGRAVRKPRTGPGRARGSTITGLVSISERPAEANDRAVPGHWEGDLIMGAGNTSAVGTLVERSTGFVMLLHLSGDHTAATVAEAMCQTVPKIPEILWRSLTWDRGSEMALHTMITQATGLPIYFADPYSPWQRGTNENTNGLLRQYLPKGSDLSFYGPGMLDQIAAELNSRPRKRHNWATPAEMLDKLLTNDNNEVAPTA